jgi:CheY-like chemotaxis protein
MRILEGKIILVDDLKYEKELLEIALHQKKWDVEVNYFKDAIVALEYLRVTKDRIFLVISDMNMPLMSGLDFKKLIDNDPELLKKAIPFIFVTTSATKKEVEEAYNYRVQGYFKKPISIDEQAEMIDTIIRYWIISNRPSNAES